MIILPNRFRLKSLFLRPNKIRDGSFRELSPFENLINHELLLILNGKPTAKTLNFSIQGNRDIKQYDWNLSRRTYTIQQQQDIEDIFSLSDANNMMFIPININTDAVYFLPENLNSGAVLAYYIETYNVQTLISRYVLGRLQGWSLEDIEANLFCYQNGQNIVELRTANANNFNNIIFVGNSRIRQIQEGNAFKKWLLKNPPQMVTASL